MKHRPIGGRSMESDKALKQMVHTGGHVPAAFGVFL